jgi:carbon-monoxide dehydrogenase iron sulfur subunit
MKLEVVDPQLCVGCQSCMFACTRRMGNAGMADSCIMVRSKGGMANGFVVVVCRSCQDPPCSRACAYEALIPKKNGGVVLQPNQCIGCGACRNACALNAVFWDNEQSKPLICIQCGYCVKFCPYDVLELVDDQRRGDL